MSTMKLLTISCLIGFLANTVSSLEKTTENVTLSPNEGGSCNTFTEKSGICTPVLHCRHAIDPRNLQNSDCEFEGKGFRVCCPIVEDDDDFLQLNSSSTESEEIFIRNDDSSPQNSSNEDNSKVENKFIKRNNLTLENTTSSENSTKQSMSNNKNSGRNRDGFTLFPFECGHSISTFSRIVGGQEASIGAWPWMAIIFYVRTSRKSVECGGVIITARHVLTAAHCVVTSKRGLTMRPRQLLVRLGDHDTTREDEGTNPIDLSVNNVIKYNSFDVRNFQNDIAILVLESTITFTPHIAPICLPFDVFLGQDLTDRNAFTAGWGSLSYGGQTSSTLQEVQIRIWENTECQTVFRRIVPITDVNLCAGGDGDKDACRGDSGGPLMLSHTDNKFYLVGLVSFGKKCAVHGFPGVYTRITSFLDWIEYQVDSTM